jgi:hypothetical protein
MSSAAPRPDRTLDLEGLSNAEIEVVKGFVAYVRTPEGKRELVRSSFAHFWDEWKKRAPEMSDEEAAGIAAEAVAFARGRA